MDLVLLAASRPWTYWMAPVLVATGVLAIATMAYGYYRNVLDPYYRMIDHRAEKEPTSATADVVPLDDARRSRRRPTTPRLAA